MLGRLVAVCTLVTGFSHPSYADDLDVDSARLDQARLDEARLDQARLDQARFDQARLDQARFDHGLLWRIERPGVSPSYLFGTIHVSDPRASDTAKRVANRLDEIAVVATEVSFERADLRRMAIGLNQAPGRSLSAQLAPDEFASISRLLAPLGFDAAAVDRLSPFGAIAILTVRPRRDLPSMDIQLYNTAKGRALKTIGLESVEEQLASIDRLDEPALLEELRTALRAPDQFHKQIETRVRTYLSESIGTLAGKMTAKSKSGVTTVLIDDRNARMQSRAQTLAEAGAAFIAVGASHLAGDTGLLVGFERAGYTLTRVSLD